MCCYINTFNIIIIGRISFLLHLNPFHMTLFSSFNPHYAHCVWLTHWNDERSSIWTVYWPWRVLCAAVRFLALFSIELNNSIYTWFKIDFNDCAMLLNCDRSSFFVWLFRHIKCLYLRKVLICIWERKTRFYWIQWISSVRAWGTTCLRINFCLVDILECNTRIEIWVDSIAYSGYVYTISA